MGYISMNKVETYVENAINIANNNEHGYSQVNRWGNPDYDCSSLVITVVNNSGIPVKANGASYTGNMYKAFIKSGFSDVTKYTNISTGKGLIRGDILLNPYTHTEIYIGDGLSVGAHIDEKGTTKGAKKGDNTGHEISIEKYRNKGYKCVLRYPQTNVNTVNNSIPDDIITDVINGKYGNGEARKQAIQKLGYNYSEVQKQVNNRLNSKHTTPTITDSLIKDIINGKYGNGETRKNTLKSLGYNYSEVQKKVNEYLKKH